MGATEFAKLPHIGESVKRKEDLRFLTGAGNYTDDIVQPGQKYAVFVRSRTSWAWTRPRRPPCPAWPLSSPARTSRAR